MNQEDQERSRMLAKLTRNRINVNGLTELHGEAAYIVEFSYAWHPQAGKEVWSHSAMLIDTSNSSSPKDLTEVFTRLIYIVQKAREELEG